MVLEGAGEGGSSTTITVEDGDVEGGTGGGNQAWRAWTILLVVRMSSTWESVTGETEGSRGARALMTSEGVRVERGDGEADHITAAATLGATSRSQVDLSTCLFPCFRGRGGTSGEGAAAERVEGGGLERGRGGGAEGAGAAEAVLPFGELQVLFFGRVKNNPGPKGPGPSPSRTLRTNTNIQHVTAR